MRLDRLAEQQAEYRQRQEGDEQVEREALRGFLFLHQARGHRSQLGAVFPAHREDRRELDDDLEHLAALVVEVQQIADQDQMPGGRDRQEFGQAFDHAKNGGFDEQQDVHVGLTR